MKKSEKQSHPSDIFFILSYVLPDICNSCFGLQTYLLISLMLVIFTPINITKYKYLTLNMSFFNAMNIFKRSYVSLTGLLFFRKIWISKDSEKHLTNTYVSQKLLPNREQKELLNLTKHNKIKTTVNFIFKGKI